MHQDEFNPQSIAQEREILAKNRIPTRQTRQECQRFHENQENNKENRRKTAE
jgi:hypothetical protein